MDRYNFKGGAVAMITSNSAGNFTIIHIQFLRLRLRMWQDQLQNDWLIGNCALTWRWISLGTKTELSAVANVVLEAPKHNATNDETVATLKCLVSTLFGLFIFLSLYVE